MAASLRLLAQTPASPRVLSTARRLSSRAAASSELLTNAEKRYQARDRYRRGERVDSVSDEILADRATHKEAIANAWPEDDVIAKIKELKLGRPKNWQHQGKVADRRMGVQQNLNAKAALLGRAGIGMHKDWLRLNRGALPEVAIMGHANCGKSSLLNALAGSHRHKGLAAVSARAGWTAELSFYGLQPQHLSNRLKERAERKAARSNSDDDATDSPPIKSEYRLRIDHGELGIVLVDTPGYGFTVGSQEQLRTWGRLLADYLDHSPRLRLALLLIDSTRGVCAADVSVLKRLRVARVPVLIALTKTDLLNADDLACSHAVVSAQLDEVSAAFEEAAHLNPDADSTLAPKVPKIRTRPHPLMLSSQFFTGVNHLWRVLRLELANLADERVIVSRERGG